MKMRTITDGTYYVGAVDWERRIFDSLIPLPDGTSYNAYLIKGSEKTVLIDTVDPAKKDILFEQLESIDHIDYIIHQHAEQDHSGSLPFLLEKYKDAKVVTNPRCKDLLIDHLHVPEDIFICVKDGDTLSLGNKTLTFIYTPWVHWPETMSTYLAEDKILFTCDFFGSHLATSDLFVPDEALVLEAAKRYYAEIMMPFRSVIQANLKKLSAYDISIIAPSHGPLYNRPSFIIDAYNDWVSSPPKNLVVIPYISMHESTRIMVKHLTTSLIERNVSVQEFDLTVTDIGKLAISLVDAGTLVIGTPTVHIGPHPLVVNAAFLTNVLRPKLQHLSVIGSFGWGGKTLEQLTAMTSGLKAELLTPVLCKGLPRKEDLEAIEALAETIQQKHTEKAFT